MSRGTNGIVIVDKPAEMSSAQVVSRIKRLFDARKVGHAGTLDPMATGVLVCCLNDATRLARFFLAGDKTYEATLRLGIETDTQDSTGAVVGRSEVTDISRQALESVLKRFTGAIDQRPPVYSALKYRGVPLYKHARKGNPVQKPARKVLIRGIRVRQIALPETVFEVSCSSGTYIRTLCADIGSALGCGGHLKGLRRIESCSFTLEEASSLPELEAFRRGGTLDDRIVGMADALRHMPEHQAAATLTDRIRHGTSLTGGDIHPIGEEDRHGYVKVVDEHQTLIAVIHRSPDEDDYRYCCVFPREMRD